jgi:hypothetical protein
MRAHQLDKNGVIINTIEVESLTDFPNLVDASLGGVIGDSIVNGVVIPQPGPTKETKQAVIQKLIDALEFGSLLNRGSREFEIVSIQDLAARQAVILQPANPGSTVDQITAIILAKNVYYTKLILLNKQITDLRNQMAAV